MRLLPGGLAFRPLRVEVQGSPSALQRRLVGRLGRVSIVEAGLPDLGWLVHAGERMRSIAVADYSCRDVTAVNAMPGLEELLLITCDLRHDHLPLDPTHLTRLRKLDASWSPAIDPLSACAGLERVTLYDVPARASTAFLGPGGPEELHLLGIRSGQIRVLPDQGAALRHLRIANARLDGSSSFVGCRNLEKVIFDGVRGLEESVLESLARAPELRSVVFEDCGTIPTLSALRVPPLRELRLTGSTVVGDGDLAGLAGLRKVSFPHRAHYNATPGNLRRR